MIIKINHVVKNIYKLIFEITKQDITCLTKFLPSNA